MKQPEINDIKSNGNGSTEARKDCQDQAVPSFNSLNPRKHIFIKKNKRTLRRKHPITIQLSQQSTINSNQDSKSQALPILQSKQCESQIQFSKTFDRAEEQQKGKCQPSKQTVQIPVCQSQASSHNVQVGDAWIYMPSIGQHLLRQQERLPMPLFLYSENFAQENRMSCLQLIFAFCLRYGFKVETIFLAFSIYHRIAFAPQFQRFHNSLKAVTSLFVAAKYQEIAIPKVEFFTKFDTSYKVAAHQILKFESQILIHLNFNLSFPTVLQFIDILRVHHNFDRSLRDRLIHICYSSLKSLALWQEKASLLGLACLHLVRPEIQLGQFKSQELNTELKWRVAELLRLGAGEWN